LIEKKIRAFLWSRAEDGKKICQVKWDTMILPKDHGGLGIGSILAMNKALLFK
jgi:hypothetical protein